MFSVHDAMMETEICDHFSLLKNAEPSLAQDRKSTFSRMHSLMNKIKEERVELNTFCNIFPSEKLAPIRTKVLNTAL